MKRERFTLYCNPRFKAVALKTQAAAYGTGLCVDVAESPTVEAFVISLGGGGVMASTWRQAVTAAAAQGLLGIAEASRVFRVGFSSFDSWPWWIIQDARGLYVLLCAELLLDLDSQESL